jgi:FlaA1/EpsC-like NDP-sugar epimerase
MRGRAEIPRGYWAASKHRRVILAAVDVLAWAVCLTLADLLRYQFNTAKVLTLHLAGVICLAAAAQLALGLVTPLYRSAWRIGSFEQLLCLIPIWAVVTTALTSLVVVPTRHVVPVSATVGGAAMMLLTAGGVRAMWRLMWEWKRPSADGAERTIIFGAGDAGAQLVDALLSDPKSAYWPVALLDDDPAKRNLRLRRMKVSGTRQDLAVTAERVRADSVVIAIPSADSSLVRSVADLALEAGLEVKVLPTVSEMLSGVVRPGDIRTVTPEDLLGRRTIDTQVHEVAGYLTGRRILVTGAGGSIGSELCRQIARQQPASLIMLDRDESALHQVQLSIEGRALLDDRCLALCDIRDAGAVGAVFDEHRPEVVFHAAALKHLPLLEMWPAEAVKTNLRGTQNVLDACAAYGVDRFVNVSSDKAVNPTSVLGYTKRIGERLTAAAGEEWPGVYLSVRFGNVLDSRGSFLTTFRAQIAAGDPLTVTHPEVCRYFMTVEEAVELVIQAGALGSDGEVLVLDMGEPVRIAEVAARMLAAAHRPREIIYTGLRPGEKIREELFFDDESDERPCHPLISHVAAPPMGASALAALERDQPAMAVRARLASACQAVEPGYALPEVIDLTDRAGRVVEGGAEPAVAL